MLWVLLPCPCRILPPYHTRYASSTASHWCVPQHPQQFQPQYTNILFLWECLVFPAMPQPNKLLFKELTQMPALPLQSCLTPPGGFRRTASNSLRAL